MQTTKNKFTVFTISVMIFLIIFNAGSLHARTGETQIKPASPPAGFKNEYTQVNGVKIHYVIGGKGQPLLLIHGFGQNWYMWNRLLPELSKHFTVIAPDLRGVGESSKPAGGYDKKSQKGGFKVNAGKDRYQEELNIMGGQFDCKLSSKDTNGALLIYDTVRESKGGPAFHVHHNQDEVFYVIKGEFLVKVGDDVLNLKAGDFAFAPRKIPHAFAKISEGEAQVLVMFQPAGSMEDFFLQMSKLGKDIPKNQETTLKKLWADHGMEIVGPPLKF